MPLMPRALFERSAEIPAPDIEPDIAQILRDEIKRQRNSSSIGPGDFETEEGFTIDFKELPPGTRDIPTPEEAQQDPLGSIERFEGSTIGGVVPSTTRLNPTPLTAGQKAVRGEDLTPLEQEMVRAMFDAGGYANLVLGGKLEEILGRATAAGSISGLGTLGGGMAGGALTKSPTGMVIGSMVGSGAATEVNIMLGLESDSNLNRIAATLLPGAAGFTNRLGRQAANQTRVAKFLRASRMAEIADEMIGTSFQGTYRDAVNAAFTKARAAEGFIPLSQTKNAILELGRTRVDMVDELVDAVNAVNPNTGAVLQTVLQRTPAAGAGLDPNLGRTAFTATEMIDVRQALTDLRNFHYSGRGAANTSRGKIVDDVTDILDKEIAFLAGNGDNIAAAYLDANKLARLKFAQDDMVRMVNRAEQPVIVGGQSTSGTNIDSMIKEVNAARRAEKFELPEGHAITGMVRTLDDIGGMAKFMDDLEELKRLSPRNNIMILEGAGPIGRTGRVATQSVGSKAIAEVLVNPLGRKYLMQFLRITKGRINVPVLATILSATRAATGQDVSGATQEFVQFIVNMKDLPANIATMAEQQKGPEARRKPLFSAPQEQGLGQETPTAFP